MQTRGRSRSPVRGVLALALAACTSDASAPDLNAARAGTLAAGDPTVESVIPSAAPQDTTLDIRVLGSGYDRGSVAELVLDGLPTSTIVTNSTRYRNSSELVANVTISLEALVAAYDVLVTTSRGKKGIGIEKFQVNLKGKPPSCPDRVDVTLSGLTGALQSDGGSYGAHLTGVNGYLSFDLRNASPPRTVLVTTSLGSTPRAARTYTNTHESECGLTAMDPAGSTGTGVLEVEWSDPSNRYTLRYGKNCVGEFGTVVPDHKITTARTGDVWTLSGADGTGIVCRGKLNGKASWTQVGTAGAFTMRLERSP